MPAPSSKHPLSAERRAIFLATLRECGSWSEACARATPHSSAADRPGHGAWRDLRNRDPLFASEVEAARSEFLGRVEAEIARRALDPQAADSRLLLRLASRLDASWSEVRKTELSGRLEHSALGHDPRQLTLSVDDVLLLDESEREQLVGLIERIRELRAAQELPAPIAAIAASDTPAEVEVAHE